MVLVHQNRGIGQVLLHVVPEKCPRGHFAIARTQVVKAKVRSQGDAAQGPAKSWFGRGQVRQQDVSFSNRKVKHCHRQNGPKGRVLSPMSPLRPNFSLKQTSASKVGPNFSLNILNKHQAKSYPSISNSQSRSTGSPPLNFLTVGR